ncbi:site-specific integrase [Sphingopyxis sp. SCN 67-31]|uniref:tyrosine-type recombinase/integrase n=1 Tax=Sphingopyxis sp. SCN 67-31 TaxID=1660142 RepID=UPI000A91A27B|nr:site-specific integrase [Sphingopyxis sp. SCN 67-31]
MTNGKRITKRAVDSYDAKGRPTCLWDGELRGFGIKFNPSGTKVFILQYRNAERRQRRLVIGRYGVLTVEQARDKARILLGEIAKGNDPAEDKIGLRNAVTVGELCDWYLEEAEAGRLLGRMRRPIKASSLSMDRSRIECHIRPLLGRRKVCLLRVTDIEQMQIDIAAGKTARSRAAGRGGVTSGGKGAAARSVGTLHAIFAHAQRHGLIDANPALGVRKFTDEKKMRRLSRNEIVDLGHALREVEETEHPVGLAIIRLLLLSGMRLNEAQGLEHEWVSEEGYISFPDTKTNAQIRPIGKAAVALIRAQPRLENSLYVFPSDFGRSHFRAADGVFGRICKRLGLTDVTAHTLRHTFGSIAGDLGYSELTIAAMLGHASRSVTNRYVHVDEVMRSAVDRVSQEIALLLDKGDTSGSQPSAFTFSGPLITTGLTGDTAGVVTIRAAAPRT